MTAQDTTTYLAVFGDCVGNPEVGYSQIHTALGPHRATKGLAIRDGFRAQGSDDFNVAEIRNGEIVRLWWMDEDIGEETEVLAHLAAELWIIESATEDE